MLSFLYPLAAKLKIDSLDDKQSLSGVWCSKTDSDDSNSHVKDIDSEN